MSRQAVSKWESGGENMYKIFYRATLIVGIVICLCTSAGAIEKDVAEATYDCAVVETDTIMRATGFFEANVEPYSNTRGDEEFHLEEGETVRIYATYSPQNVCLDFGLIAPDGVFHYVSAEDGTIDTTIEVPESGNYRLGIRNNSGNTVKVSGFVKY